MTRAVVPAFVVGTILAVVACEKGGPDPLPAGQVECAQCRMRVMDRRFAAQVRTAKGRVLFFDAIECARTWADRPEGRNGEYYLHSFLEPPRWLPAQVVWVAEWQGIRSPMGKSWGAFASREEAMEWLRSVGAPEMEYRLYRWQELPRDH